MIRVLLADDQTLVRAGFRSILSDEDDIEVVAHVSRIMAKLHARDRAQLVVLAYEGAIITPGWLSS